MFGLSPGRCAASVVCSCLAVTASVSTAAAAPSDAGRLRAARAHYENGVGHYNLDEFAPALVEFTEAYRLKPDPSFLFNIAQCHRKLGQLDAAIDYYRKFLRNVPDARNRPDVERLILELQGRTAGTSADSGPAVAAPLPAPVAQAQAAPTALLAPSPTPSPAAALVEAPGPAASVSVVPPASSPPIYRRWWFWVAVGAVAAGAAVTATIALSGSQDPYVGTLGVTRVPSN